MPRTQKPIKTGKLSPATSKEPGRIHKVLATGGVGSRRQIERWIEEGRIQVDGKKATLGQLITGREKVKLDGRLLSLSGSVAPVRLIAYNKPAGEVTTRDDPQGRPTVFDHLPRLRGARWISVGRLDLNTSGLLIFTTDGELANALMHPSGEFVREYSSRILGTPTEEDIEKLTSGVELDDGPARFESVVFGGGGGRNRWYTVTLKEGRNREVRRLWEAVGLRVSRLVRTAYGPVVLGRGLKQGRFRDLGFDEAKSLYTAAGLKLPRLTDRISDGSGKSPRKRRH